MKRAAHPASLADLQALLTAAYDQLEGWYLSGRLSSAFAAQGLRSLHNERSNVFSHSIPFLATSLIVTYDLLEGFLLAGYLSNAATNRELKKLAHSRAAARSLLAALGYDEPERLEGST
jgi:hypothetical protein